MSLCHISRLLSLSFTFTTHIKLSSGNQSYFSAKKKKEICLDNIKYDLGNVLPRSKTLNIIIDSSPSIPYLITPHLIEKGPNQPANQATNVATRLPATDPGRMDAIEKLTTRQDFAAWSILLTSMLSLFSLEGLIDSTILRPAEDDPNHDRWRRLSKKADAADRLLDRARIRLTSGRLVRSPTRTRPTR